MPISQQYQDPDETVSALLIEIKYVVVFFIQRQSYTNSITFISQLAIGEIT